jgi:chromosome partitioning protein
MKTISIVNQKGGVSKTSTAVNLSSGLAEMGYRTLIIDMDPQGNASTSLGADNFNNATIYNVLHGGTEIQTAVLETGIVNLYMISSNILTAKLEREMSKISGCEETLFTALSSCKDIQTVFDFCIIDCPPSLGALSTNALVASDYCIIPVQPGIFALEGVNSLLDTINAIKEEYGKPDILGLLLSFFDARTTMSHKMLKDLKPTGLIFNTIIRVSQAIPKAQASKQPVNIYQENSRGSDDYRKLVKEIINKLGVGDAHGC